MDDDCYLPFNKREPHNLTKRAAIYASGACAENDVDNLRNGIDRPIGDEGNYWEAGEGASLVFSFDKMERIKGLRLVFDSDLNRTAHNMPYAYPLHYQGPGAPQTLVKRFTVEASADGENYREITRINNNYQRLVYAPFECDARRIRITPLETWGCGVFRIFAADLLE